MNEIQGKHADLSIRRPETLTRIARALSSELRVSVLAELSRRSRSVGELAKVLDVPMSSMAVAVKTLEEAGLIRCDYQPGAHGSLKICNRKLDTISIELFDSEAANEKEMVTIEMPIGGYSLAGEIEPTCGILNEQMPIGAMDLKKLIGSFDDLSASVARRGSNYVVYMKKAAYISDTLGIIGADSAMLEFESIRVNKGMHGEVMRIINCDNANVDRTLTAAEEQRSWLEAIASAETGREPEAGELTDPMSDFWTEGLRHLPPQLKEAAYLRLYKPEASLTEIGESLTPPVGKAAISKRFAKLRALAENANGEKS